jgi:lipopolysaccharide/colanic/teichoic acid biosynthesis glycosyltransferase
LEHVAGDATYRDAPQVPEVSGTSGRRGTGAARVSTDPIGLTSGQALRKRAFDLVVAASGLVLLSWLIAAVLVAATIDTRTFGFFRQERVGRGGKVFRIVKIRSMRIDGSITTSVTTTRDPRITRLGRFWRRTKLDELPQLWNVLRGEMSLVGPRPEVPGFADLLTGTDALILTIRPGITGPATLHFREEERLLALQDDPEEYNRTVLFPAKVQMNLEYIRTYSFRRDLALLWRTFT